MAYFQIDVFGIYMLWGRVSKNSNHLLVHRIWVKHTLSMMCGLWTRPGQSEDRGQALLGHPVYTGVFFIFLKTL
jgi:hypothetical protein